MGSEQSIIDYRSQFFDDLFDQNTSRLAKCLIQSDNFNEKDWSFIIILSRIVWQILRFYPSLKKFVDIIWGDVKNPYSCKKDRDEIGKYLLMEPLGRLQWIKKIKEVIQYYPKNIGTIYDQGNFGTCWAYAISTAIYITQSRIIGRKVTPFMRILSDLINQFGLNGQYVDFVMREVFPKYGIRYKEAKYYELKDIIYNGRVCVVGFEYTDLQKKNLMNFVHNPSTKTKVLTKYDLNKPIPNYIPIQKKYAHAVVLSNIEGDNLLLINSWGTNCGDNGKHWVKIDAFDTIYFYDVFYEESDLTQYERCLWKQKCEDSINKFFSIIDNIEIGIIQKTLFFYTSKNLGQYLLNIVSGANPSNKSSFLDIFSLFEKEVPSFTSKFSSTKQGMALSCLSQIGYGTILTALFFQWCEVKNELEKMINEFWDSEQRFLIK